METVVGKRVQSNAKLSDKRWGMMRNITRMGEIVKVVIPSDKRWGTMWNTTKMGEIVKGESRPVETG